MSQELTTVNEQKELWEFSTRLSKSKMIPQHFAGRVEDIFVTILYGREFGMSPINALNSICVIQGQVTLKVAAINAIVRSRFPKAPIKIEADQKNLVVKVTAQRDLEDVSYIAEWDMARAKQMGLADKHNWKAQPLNMLRARALSEALRMVFPDVLMGLYSQEEMIDVVETKTVEQDLIDGGKEYLQEYIKNDMEKNPDHYEIGESSYMVQNAKFRGKQLRDIDPEEMADYLETLEKRENQKGWEKELITSMRLYLGKLNAIEAGI